MRYIAAQYERLGLQPAGDGGGWLQRFDIVGMKSEVTTPITVAARDGKTLTLRPGVDSVVTPGLQQAAMGVRDADLVFVGYGITAPEQKWDDFKGVDVRGKVLLVMNNDPEDDPALFAGTTRLYYGRWDYKYAEAARHGAAGVIIIHTEHSASYPWHVVQSSWSGQQFELPAAPGEPRLTLKMWATEDACRRIAQLAGKSLDELRRAAERRDFRPVALGVKLTAALKTTLTRTRTANVLGKLPGSDPRLGEPGGRGLRAPRSPRRTRRQGGHHLQRRARQRVRRGRDAEHRRSGHRGRAAAEAIRLCSPPSPPRSRVCSAVSSSASTRPVPAWAHRREPQHRRHRHLGQELGHGYIGFGKSTLDDVVVAVARAQGRQVTGDERPDKGGFYRSDQFNFAKLGVPALYLTAGVRYPGHDAQWGRDLHEKYERERYHQPSDQIDETWNLDGAVDDVQLMVVALLRIADAPKMPEWHRGDEFEAARKKALAAAGTAAAAAAVAR